MEGGSRVIGEQTRQIHGGVVGICPYGMVDEM